MNKAPVIKTKRLVLRGHILADFEPLRAFFDTDRAKFVGAPISDARLWQGFAADVGAWELLGMGGWAITLPDGTMIGQISVNQPKHFPEVELGWMLFEGHSRKGYAAEAAIAVRNWAVANLPLTSLVSYIDPENGRSILLAAKLGARIDNKATKPQNETCLVFRYKLAAVDDTDGSVEAYA
ncbi:GNAT family N-acetyltransferase [Falsihalocynthiibacter sp. BN13B15]|uniref:GNAT family N-acetyltransferase n=1 Tax=Falsihalocynthiibacter sp. BN13B15 TaxID=3240871 RepID=UPI00350EEAE8